MILILIFVVNCWYNDAIHDLSLWLRSSTMVHIKGEFNILEARGQGQKHQQSFQVCAKVLLEVFETLIGELKFKRLLLWRVVIVIIKNKLNQNNNLRIYIGVVQCRMYCMVLKYASLEQSTIQTQHIFTLQIRQLAVFTLTSRPH